MTDPNNDSRKHSKSRKRKRTKRLKKQLIILVILALIIASGYYYINYYTLENVSYTTSNDINAEYTLIENYDSLKYQAVVIYNRNIDVNTIANTFYKSDLFWPYIYIANKEIINNPLDIEKDVVLKIPRLSDSLINVKDPANIDRIKLLGDSILENLVIKYEVNTLMRTS